MPAIGESARQIGRAEIMPRIGAGLEDVGRAAAKSVGKRETGLAAREREANQGIRRDLVVGSGHEAIDARPGVLGSGDRISSHRLGTAIRGAPDAPATARLGGGQRRLGRHHVSLALARRGLALRGIGQARIVIGELGGAAARCCEAAGAPRRIAGQLFILTARACFPALSWTRFAVPAARVPSGLSDLLQAEDGVRKLTGDPKRGSLRFFC